MKTLINSNLFNRKNNDFPAVQFLFSTSLKRLLKIPLILIFLMLATGVNAVDYFLTVTGAANAHLPASWNSLEDGTGTPATNFTTNGDVFMVPINVLGVVGGDMLVGPSTVGADWSMEIYGSLEITSGNVIRMQNYKEGETVVNTTINVNETIIFGAQSQIMNNDVASGKQGLFFNLNHSATLKTANSNGIIFGSAGSIDEDLVIYLSENAIYYFDGDEQTTNGLPAYAEILLFVGTGTKHLAADVNSLILVIAPQEFVVTVGPRSRELVSRVREMKSKVDLGNSSQQLFSEGLLANIMINNFIKGVVRRYAKSEVEPLVLHIAPGQIVNTFALYNLFDYIDPETNERLYEIGLGIKILADPLEMLPPGSLTYINTVTGSQPSVTVQFYSNAFIDRTGQTPDYKWQYFGIPFRDYIPGSTLGDYKKNRWDETFEGGTDWKIVETNESMQWIKGYAITQDIPAMYEIKGYLTNEDIFQYPLSYTTGNGNDFPGQHILANPYTTSIPIPTIEFYNTEESVAFYHTGSINEWNNNSGATNTTGMMPGQYLNVPKNLAGTETDLPLFIQSMQGFLVKAISNQLPNIPSFGGIKEAHKSPVYIVQSSYISIPYPTSIPQPISAAQTEDTQKIYTRIDISGNTLRDKVWLFTDPNCTKTFDNGWDSRKIMGSSASPQLYVAEEGMQFQVNSMDDVNGTLLGFCKGADSEYKMTFTHHNTELAYPNGLYLMDLVDGKTIDISSNGSVYNFIQNPISQVNQQRIPSESAVVRFKIITSPGTITDINNPETLIKVFASDRSIIVDNKTGSQAELVLYNIAGKKVLYKTISVGISTLQADIPTGAYIANVIAEKSIIKSSIIIK